MALYLVVNIGAAALHNHLHPGGTPPATSACRLTHDVEPAQASTDDGVCLFCQVSHLARTLIKPTRVDSRPVASGQAVTPEGRRCPCRLARSVRARAPPFID